MQGSITGVLVLPKPLDARSVWESGSVISRMSGRADGINSSWAILELAGRMIGWLVRLERMTVTSPR